MSHLSYVLQAQGHVFRVLSRVSSILAVLRSPTYTRNSQLVTKNLRGIFMGYCPLRPYMKCPLHMINDANRQDIYDKEDIDNEEERQAGFSFVRFLHASPNGPALDIYIDKMKAVSNLTYASIAGYTALPATMHEIAVYPLGQTDNPLTQFTINPSQDSYRTIVIAGLAPNIQLRTYIDSSELIPGNESRFRFVHMSPRAPALDVVEETGQVLFSGVTFGRMADYITVAPGIYTLRVRMAGTPNVVLGLPQLTFSGARAYTIYAIGLLGGSPPLTAVLLSDGRR